MAIEDLSLLNIVLLLLPLVLLAALVALAVLGRGWRLKAGVNIKAARGLIRQLQQEIDWTTGKLGGFKPEDPEPFGSRVAEILPVIGSVKENFAALNGQYVQLHGQVGRQVGFAGFLSVLVPASWFSIQSQAKTLLQRLEIERGRLGVARAQVDELSRLGWQTALQARSVFLVQQEAGLLFERLRARGLHGVEFDEINNRRRQVRKQLDDIPIFFMTAGEDDVIRLAERPEIAAAHARLESAKLELEEIISLGCSWESGLSEAGSSVQAFSRSLAGTQRLLVSSASRLDLAEHEGRFLTLQSGLHDLQAFLDAPEVERLAEVLPRTQASLAELKEIQDQVGRSRQVLLALRDAFSEAQARLTQAAELQESLINHALCPLVPDLSSPRLVQFQKEFAALQENRGLHQPAALLGQLAEIQLVAGQINDLLSDLKRLDYQHGQLVGRLSDPAFLEFETWLQGARQLVERLQLYAEPNFAAQERPSDLPAHLNTLEEQWRLLRSGTAGVAVQESRLDQLLGDLRDLLKSQQDLDQHMQGLQHHLSGLEQAERAAAALVEDAQAALGQVGFLVRSNPFLAGIAAQELARLQREVKELAILLGERDQGKVSDKARLVAALSGRVRKAALQWLDALGKDLQAKTQELKSLLSEIDSIGRIQEGAVDQARAALSEAPPAQEVGLLAKEGAPLVGLIPEFKRRCDFWQRCVGVRKELIELAAPLKRADQQAAGHQQQAQQALTSILAWMSQRESWPPAAVSLEQEQALLHEIDLRWQALRSRPLRAIQLVQELGELSAGCQSLHDRIQSRADQAAREMQQAEEVEADLLELAALWQSQWYAYRENAAVSVEIKSLLDEIEKSLKSIRTRYKRRQMDYQQVMDALKILYRKVRFYQVELDPGHALDAMGNIQSRR